MKNTPPFPLVVGPAQLALAQARTGHADPWVSDRIITGNLIIRGDFDSPVEIRKFKKLIDELSRYDGYSFWSRWRGNNKLSAAVKKGLQEGLYVALIAETLPSLYTFSRPHLCSLSVVAMHEPFEVHGVPLFTVNNRIAGLSV